MRSYLHPLQQTYSERIKKLFGSALIAYWPLNEPSGATCEDIAGNNHDGTYTSVTLAQPGIGDGKTSAQFNGTTSRSNVYSTGLRDVFNGAEGSLILWAKVANAGVWTDSADRAFAQFCKSDFTLPFRIYKPTSNSAVTFSVLGKSYTTVSMSTIGWACYAVTWSNSNDRMRSYLNGLLKNTTTGLTAWGANVLGSAIIGAGTTSAWLHNGYVAHVMLLNREATAEEILKCVNYIKFPYRFIFLGTSITAVVDGWQHKLRVQYHEGMTYINDFAVSGSHIMSDYAENLTKQVGQAWPENGDTVIIELGTNDANGGDMNALQAKIVEQVALLKVGNPKARIFWLNVLPRWTNNTTGPEVALGNIRTAVASACQAAGITCWDTYTDPWITQAQTLDGTHPTDAGHVAICNRVLGLI